MIWIIRNRRASRIGHSRHPASEVYCEWFASGVAISANLAS